MRGRWPDPTALTWRADPRGAPVAADVFARAVTRAISVWNATGVVRLTPLAADAAAAADVTLCWRRGHHGACEPFGSSHAVAHAGLVGPGTFVHFDADRSWSEATATPADGDRPASHSLFHTALHELGHVLGLGHSAAADALMNLEVERPEAIAAADLAGLHSLYGGGRDGPGDLRVVAAGGAVRATLRLVAPPGRSDFLVFDTDGDGRDELLVWRTDPAGHGALTTYGFDARCRLCESAGPFLGATTAGMRLTALRTDAGERLLIGTFAGGRRIVRRFDDYGHLQPRSGEPLDAAALARATATPTGDLDGDGAAERVERVD